ncbi:MULTISPECIES: TetR/AcrR family transcriptional regulator [unclassified Breznakia]|uniref:TetR/AcrR family transcriptional regulator n=1 Tax=unclassified Breznakia TaxID=2623764 RepID=UPI0024741171|nr:MULTISPECIES: TetR/AcrR family transcriptional regulator [unclassified Breznakia]MDH6367637.1 AcrR family transcriptional regulator [Breznakia sp. PH1-1]MDH6403987.1 AcrR family transcriptional regulator [Breznakia sp. PF1-11]MDH6411696.1 AcrR family transcriptional regulator [Breznakia sp. PFB1-11]MDH6414766.1 AcrR family transcriptional regulator [Breznakia sp. PFB1-14]MDH6416047.1 AcrR family transcriptional regulator [Breznakia sp. PFB1-4]
MSTQRHTETTNKIKKTFTKLLKEKGLDAMSVTDIARGSKINRGTFYLHYLDKYDLMDKMQDDLIHDLTLILDDQIESAESNTPSSIFSYAQIVKALQYVKQEFAFIETLSGEKGDPKFVARFKAYIAELIKEKVQHSQNLKMGMDYLPKDYADEVLLSGVFSIILLWIDKGAIETPKQVADMIIQVCEQSMFGPFQVDTAKTKEKEL